MKEKPPPTPDQRTEERSKIGGRGKIGGRRRAFWLFPFPDFIVAIVKITMPITLYESAKLVSMCVSGGKRESARAAALPAARRCVATVLLLLPLLWAAAVSYMASCMLPFAVSCRRGCGCWPLFFSVTGCCCAARGVAHCGGAHWLARAPPRRPLPPPWPPVG